MSSEIHYNIINLNRISIFLTSLVCTRTTIDQNEIDDNFTIWKHEIK